MTAQVASEIDTRDMVIVHRVFRREFRLLPSQVRGAVGDPSRAAAVAKHGAEIMTALHHHHHGEDELVWPKLQARATLSRELLGRMESDHKTISDLIDSATSMLASWGATSDSAAGAELAGVLDRLSSELDAHLALEEEQVLPVIARTLTEAEWAEVGERGMASIPKSRLLVFLGYMLEETSVEERSYMMSHVPPPARLAYRMIGQRKYQREVAGLRAGIPAQRGHS